MEEVKAARAGSIEEDTNNIPLDHLTSSGEIEQPRQPYSLHSRRKRKGKNSWLKKLFKKLSFASFKRKRAATSSETYRYLSMDDIKKAKEANDLTNESWHPDTGTDTLTGGIKSEESSASGRVRHKRHRKQRRGLFRFFKRKRKAEASGMINISELKIPEQEKVPLSLYIRPILNSTALFMISYQVAWLFYQIVVMLVASFSKIDSVLFYYEVMFPIGNHSPKWSQMNIIAITLAGPLFSILMAAFYKYFILRRLHPNAQIRLFLVWLYLNSMMLFLGAFVGGAVTRQGFGYVVDWLYMNIAFRTLLSLIFLSLIIWVSWKIVSYLPETSGQDSWKNNRYGFVLSRLVIPWFIGGIIMVLLKITSVIPQHENIFNYDAINIATLAFAVIPPMFNTKSRPHLMANKKTYPRVHRSTIAVWIIIAISLVLLIRLGLNNGLYFKFEMSLDMGRYYL